MDPFRLNVSRNKQHIAELVEAPLSSLADACASIWPEQDLLDRCLTDALETMPYCAQLYAIDPEFLQLSSNIHRDGVNADKRGQDLSQRPYALSTVPYRGFLLSAVYVDHLSRQPCITAIQAVTTDTDLRGFILADFELRNLPLADVTRPGSQWQQFKGDPAIRNAIFSQEREASAMDARLDDTHLMVHTLMQSHGVFHCKLHYSSSRVTLWQKDDPFQYHLHSIDEFVDPEIFLAYPPRPYIQRAQLEPGEVSLVLDHFAVLRSADRNLYLRSGSINIVNGMVGVTFSCDGSHYIPAREFIGRSLEYWFGKQETG